MYVHKARKCLSHAFKPNVRKFAQNGRFLRALYNRTGSASSLARSSRMQLSLRIRSFSVRGSPSSALFRYSLVEVSRNAPGLFRPGGRGLTKFAVLVFGGLLKFGLSVDKFAPGIPQIPEVENGSGISFKTTQGDAGVIVCRIFPVDPRGSSSSSKGRGSTAPKAQECLANCGLSTLLWDFSCDDRLWLLCLKHASPSA